MPRLRAMVAADVEPATAMIERANWGARREWLEFATTQPQCVPVVAEADGDLIGTGVGTANGTVGWVGTIFVAPDRRGQGLGRALTELVIDRLREAGCRTLVLVATSEGRRLYERMGFEVQTRYRIFEAGGLPASPGREAPTRVRSYELLDLEAISHLDAEATGEDRAHALRRFASPASGKVALDAAGTLAGFVIRAPWGGGATIAPTEEAAMAILDARRRTAGPEGRVRVGLVDENATGFAALERAGLQPVWSAPRMIRGDPLRWRPEWIWGQLNHAMG